MTAVVTATANGADRRVEATLRPTTLADITGQPAAVDALQKMVAGARERDELPGHVLLIGPPGTGKTTLAGAVAHDTGVPLEVLYGVNLRREKDIRPVLAKLTDAEATGRARLAAGGDGIVGGGDGAGRKLIRVGGRRSGPVLDNSAQRGGLVLMIDEIHRTWQPVQEMLFPAMEDGILDYGGGERWLLAPLMVIGATTDPDRLLSPLLDRFSMIVRLDPYTPEAIALIAQKAARALGCVLTDDGAAAVAVAADGIPRVAIKLVRAARDWATATVTPTAGAFGDPVIDAGVVDRLLSAPALVWRMEGRNASGQRGAGSVA